MVSYAYMCVFYATTELHQQRYVVIFLSVYLTLLSMTLFCCL
jgi:hypothetical protein